jgi:hypothetical protein
LTPTITPVNGIAVQVTSTDTLSQANSATPGASSTTAASSQTYSASSSISTPSETNVPISNHESVSSQQGLSHAAVGGIAVGGIGFFALIGSLWRVLLHLKSRRQQRDARKRQEVVGAPEFEPEYPPEKNNIIFSSTSLADIEIAGARLKYPNEWILHSGRLNVKDND